MTWKVQRTSQRIDVDANLDDFDELQLLQALIDAKWITEGEASVIQKRAATKEKANVFNSTDADELLEAGDHLRRGNRHEALIHLERFLGRDWIGALQ